MQDITESFDEQQRRFDSQYERTEVALLGAGTYGEVYKARNNRTGEVVAIKQMKLDGQEEGVPSTAIREIALLKGLSHKNIVRLQDVFCRPGKLLLVFEFLEKDLKKYMKGLGGILIPLTIKDFCCQLCRGVEFCHANRIIHRDLKPQNLLVDNHLCLKIADFGLARAMSIPVPKYTHEVVTVWYRPPEILLGSPLYSIPVDVWGIGCIFAEMATGLPLFAGDSEIDTVFKIFQKLGTPTEADWPGLSELPDFKPTFPKWRAKGWANIRTTLAQLGPQGVSLLEKFTAYAPRDRISARRALLEPYFAELEKGLDEKLDVTL